jgi:hypothetical protein
VPQAEPRPKVAEPPKPESPPPNVKRPAKPKDLQPQAAQPHKAGESRPKLEEPPMPEEPPPIPKKATKTEPPLKAKPQKVDEPTPPKAEQPPPKTEQPPPKIELPAKDELPALKDEPPPRKIGEPTPATTPGPHKAMRPAVSIEEADTIVPIDPLIEDVKSQKPESPDWQNAPLPEHCAKAPAAKKMNVSAQPIPKSRYSRGILDTKNGGKLAPARDLYLTALVPERRNILPEIR